MEAQGSNIGPTEHLLCVKDMFNIVNEGKLVVQPCYMKKNVCVCTYVRTLEFILHDVYKHDYRSL